MWEASVVPSFQLKNALLNIGHLFLVMRKWVFKEHSQFGIFERSQLRLVDF